MTIPVLTNIVTTAQTSPYLFYPILITATYFVATRTASFVRLLCSLVRPGIPLSKFNSKSASWAVITGASDGIGKEFSLQIAKSKFNVLLISRTESKLQALQQEIQKSTGSQVKVIPFDFAKASDEDYQSKIASVIQKLDIGVLINNVGTNHDIPTSFIDEDDQVIQDIVQVNINAALRMTRIILPKMADQKRGLVLNVGSFSGVIPVAYLSVYSGTKSFLNSFTQAIAEEVKCKGVVVQNIATYYVVSNMSKIRRSNLMIPTPKTYVKCVLSKIGVQGGSEWPYTGNGYWVHSIMNWVIDNFGAKKFWIKKAAKDTLNIRERALRKRGKEGKKE